jgi:hypothetical protein
LHHERLFRHNLKRSTDPSAPVRILSFISGPSGYYLSPPLSSPEVQIHRKKRLVLYS